MSRDLTQSNLETNGHPEQARPEHPEALCPRIASQVIRAATSRERPPGVADGQSRLILAMRCDLVMGMDLLRTKYSPSPPMTYEPALLYRPDNCSLTSRQPPAPGLVNRLT